MKTAHQRIIREREANSDDGGLYGAWWKNINHDIAASVVKEIRADTARAIVERYEWLGTMPGVVLHTYGIFFDGACAGVVVYSPEYAENLGVWDRYGYTGKLICLSRGACVHWAHPHAGSRLIRGSMRLLPEKYRVVTATVDAAAGEVGTIYQACGFDFVGVMTVGGKRASLVDKTGAHLSGRQLGRLHGTRGTRALATLGLSVTAVDRKARYFGFRGDQKEQDGNRAAIRHLIQPYPKRA